MEIDKSTCWYSKNYVYPHMTDAIRKHVPLNEIGHGKSLIELLNIIDSKEKTILDLGCGGALLHTIINGLYTGADMQHIIENVSKKCFNDLNYKIVDVINDDLNFLIDYDIIVMNALIDVMQYPLFILDKILKKCNNYVILHRQEIVDGKTIVIQNPSYGGTTYHTMININDFNNIIKNTDFEIIKNINSNLDVNTWRSFLLKKLK